MDILASIMLLAVVGVFTYMALDAANHDAR